MIMCGSTCGQGMLFSCGLCGMHTLIRDRWRCPSSIAVHIEKVARQLASATNQPTEQAVPVAVTGLPLDNT